MKAILSYGSYFNHGLKYQIQFIYEDKSEAEEISSYIESFQWTETMYPYYSNFNQNKNDNAVNIIEKTNIPENDLLPFIETLIIRKKGKLVIHNQEFTTYEENKIKEALEKLHIIATLNKGQYFGLGEQYYVIFKYITDEQINKISYDFMNNLSIIIDTTPLIGSNSLCPFFIDKNGNLTVNNTRIVGGTNIPENLLPLLLKRFVETYNAILVVGEEKFKDTIDSKRFHEALATISTTEKGRPRTRKKPTIEQK